MNKAMNNTRMCIACRIKLDKLKLIKLVKNKNNVIEIDKDKIKPGRGAYLCNNAQCISKGTEAICLQKAFKCKIDDENCKTIRNELVRNL